VIVELNYVGVLKDILVIQPWTISYFEDHQFHQTYMGCEHFNKTKMVFGSWTMHIGHQYTQTHMFLIL
jgi:hypothetical protein